MIETHRERLRVWLGKACGVDPSRVTDEQVESWWLLSEEIRSVQPTAQEAARARHLGRSLQVHPERSQGVEIKRGVHPDADRMFGLRPKLRGEG